MSALDTLYEIFGNRFPIPSQIIACLVGAIVFGFGWYSIGRHYRNEQAKTANVPAANLSFPPTPVESESPSQSQKETTSAEEKKTASAQAVPQTSAQGKRRSLRDQSVSEPSTLKQTMTNSPGGIQAGRDVTIGQKPSPTVTKKDGKP